MKKRLLSAAALVVLIALIAIPSYSQDDPIQIQEPGNLDILTEGDEAEILAFADILPENDFEDIAMLGNGGNRRFFRNPDGRGSGRGWIHDSLNLTDAQEEKIDALRLDHQRKMIDLRADLQKAKLDERELRNSDKISRSAVISSTEKINKIKNDMALARANHRMDVYEVLTPEQQKIWNDLKNDFPRRKMIQRGDGLMDGGKIRRHMMR